VALLDVSLNEVTQERGNGRIDVDGKGSREGQRRIPARSFAMAFMDCRHGT
jgi:hypothetical protein